MDFEKELNDLCQAIIREIAEINEAIRSLNGAMSPSHLETVDKLTHSLKSIKAIMKMMEEEEGGYSERSYESRNGGSSGRSYEGGSSYRGSYAGGSSSYRGSSRGSSYARRRDSMGRYSRHGDIAEQLHKLMNDAPNEEIRMEMQRLAEQVEQQM